MIHVDSEASEEGKEVNLARAMTELRKHYKTMAQHAARKYGKTLETEDVELTDRMCFVVFRISRDNKDFDVESYGRRATKKREGHDATADTTIMLAECLRRGLGKPANWNRKKASEELANSSLLTRLTRQNF